MLKKCFYIECLERGRRPIIKMASEIIPRGNLSLRRLSFLGIIVERWSTQPDDGRPMNAPGKKRRRQCL